MVIKNKISEIQNGHDKVGTFRALFWPHKQLTVEYSWKGQQEEDKYHFEIVSPEMSLMLI